jgi:hypothetical protein
MREYVRARVCLRCARVHACTRDENFCLYFNWAGVQDRGADTRVHSMPSRAPSKHAQHNTQNTNTQHTHTLTHKHAHVRDRHIRWNCCVCLCIHTGYGHMGEGREAAPGRLSVCSVAGRNFLYPARAHTRCSGCVRNTQTPAIKKNPLEPPSLRIGNERSGALQHFTKRSRLFGDSGRRLGCRCGSSPGICVV